MEGREECIGALLDRVREHSRGFTRPAIVVIGGYALRAYIPLTRYSRDCDFALPKSNEWAIDRVQAWLDDLAVEAKEQEEGHAYLHLIQRVTVGGRHVKVSLDFMEGEIRGRAGEGIILDERFVKDSTEATIAIAGRPVTIRVPSYQELLAV